MKFLDRYIRFVDWLNEKIGRGIAWLTTLLVLVVGYDVFTRYLLKQAPNVRHPDITQLRQSINRSSKSPYKVIEANLAVIRKHLPGGRLKNACHSKMQQVEELIEYMRSMEPQNVKP